MSSIKKRCFRCNGQKKLFKISSGYSKVDTGGNEVDCPLCNGDGIIIMPKNVSEIKVEEKKDLDDDKERVEAKEDDSEKREQIKERAEKPKRRRRKAD
jgi:hypothetical protein